MKICVITGSRAEYGLLRGLLKELQSRKGLDVEVMVTGMHLSPEFGYTYQYIEADGFKVSAHVEALLSSDKPAGIAKSIGLGVIGFADSLQGRDYDLVVVLGDRFEIYAASVASFCLNIPVAHIHGGEVTHGSLDDSFRHSITKFASMHFVSAPDYRRRAVQLGETPDHVHLAGALGVDNALSHDRSFDLHELERFFGLSLDSPIAVIGYHPVTNSSAYGVDALLDALAEFPSLTKIFSYSNADASGRAINKKIEHFVSTDEKATVVPSIGVDMYLSILELAHLMIGNSSSGIIESTAFGIPSVSIGPRQHGRVIGKNTIFSDEDSESIVRCIHKAISPEFREFARAQTSPYWYGGAAKNIADVIENCDLSKLGIKKFYDVP